MALRLKNEISAQQIYFVFYRGFFSQQNDLTVSACLHQVFDRIDLSDWAGDFSKSPLLSAACYRCLN